MSRINVLDENTINLIAAGEVVDRPGSVVKELVENAMDSGANKITVEIKKGGIEFIRITDNGSGIDKDDIKTAFLRHATSKIKTADDILGVTSMGFRGEALSSISAVSKVELITKSAQALTGFHYDIDGGKEGEITEIGAPDGTTIIVRNLFFNTPARRKFLKSESSEATNISDLMEHLALQRPDIAFSFINNGKQKFYTTGSGDVKEIIYKLYGKQTKDEVVPIDFVEGSSRITGYLGKPESARSNRDFETYFINNRYVQNEYIRKGIEEGYKSYMMLHKFPFCVLHLDLELKGVDVNVHPAKLEVRFTDQENIRDFVFRAVSETLRNVEMIPAVALSETKEKREQEKLPELFETKRQESFLVSKESSLKPDEIIIDNVKKDELSHGTLFNINFDDENEIVKESKIESTNKDNIINETKNQEKLNTQERTINDKKPLQLSFFEEEKVLSEKSRQKYKIIGQIFNTYWIIEYGKNVYFIDQHAAHEKVNYERIMKRIENEEFYGQLINPALVITLSAKDIEVLNISQEYLKKLGFDWSEFGGNEISLTSIPAELYYNEPRQLFLDILEELSNSNIKTLPQNILSRIASYACKASVKGGMEMSVDAINALIDELLTLENPYNCPHGRPTIFSMSEYELEKKFKRIVD